MLKSKREAYEKGGRPSGEIDVQSLVKQMDEKKLEIVKIGAEKQQF